MRSSRSRTASSPPISRYTDSNGILHRLPKYLVAGPGDRHSYLRVGIFAGIHGDEESGVLAAAGIGAPSQRRSRAGEGI